MILVRPTSDTSVLPVGLDLRYGTLESERLPLEGVSTLVYCASMGFGYVPHLVGQLEQARVKRAVFISTTAIFTTLPSASRETRLAAEAAVQRSSLDWTILRPTMIYGTRRDRNISRLLRFLKRWPVFPLCGNALWQPIYVEDLVHAVVNALDSSATSRTTYNVAGSSPLPFADLIHQTGQAIGRNVRLIPVPLEAAVVAARLTRIVTPEQVRRLAEDKAFDYSDAARDFGFTPRSFTDGVRLEAHTLRLTGT